MSGLVSCFSAPGTDHSGVVIGGASLCGFHDRFQAIFAVEIQKRRNLIAQCRVAGRDWLRERAGLYHLTAAGVCSWYEFAAAILAHRRSAADTRLVPIPTAEYPTRAARPRWSVLDCTRVRDTFGIHAPHWRAQLELVMEEVLGSA